MNAVATTSAGRRSGRRLSADLERKSKRHLLALERIRYGRARKGAERHQQAAESALDLTGTFERPAASGKAPPFRTVSRAIPTAE
jgi:hypothetical protein